MVQTISSSLFLGEILKKHNNINYDKVYSPLTQPLIPKDPILALEFNFVYSKFGLKLPLNTVEG